MFLAFDTTAVTPRCVHVVLSAAQPNTLISITEGHQKQQNTNSWSARVILDHFMSTYSWRNNNRDAEDEACIHKYQPISVSIILYMPYGKVGCVRDIDCVLTSYTIKPNLYTLH